MNKVMKYFRELRIAKQILWCYFLWYLTMCVFYFDSTIYIWLTSLGVSIVIGVALILSVSNGNHAKPDFWTRARLFMMPFCVSSFSALVKGQGFILILSPRWREDAIAIMNCALLLAMVQMLKRIR